MKYEALFEISWEVCNKVGGIHTVIATKANYIQGYFKEYYLIGPWFKNSNEIFKEENPPKKLEKGIKSLEKKGVKVHYGSWLIEGQPNVLLLEFQDLFKEKDSIKTELWEKHGIESLHSGYDFEEPMLFSYAAGLLLRKIEENYNKPIIHSHEWMTGFTNLYLKDSSYNTVFTTHATILGRSMSGSGLDLYRELEGINSYAKAEELGIKDKFTAEKAAIEKSDIFTTVSELTSWESESIHGRKPEFLVHNGLDLENYPSFEESSIRHYENKKKLNEFISYNFLTTEQFELEKTYKIFTSGRYEYRSKGFDIILEGLSKLNEELKKENSDKTIICFFFLAMPNDGLNEELLKSKNQFKNLKNYVEKKSEKIKDNLLKEYIKNNKYPEYKLLDEKENQELKVQSEKFKKKSNKNNMLTHNINDSLLEDQARKKGLNNTPNDRVKIVIYPAYLDGNDGFLNIEYEEAVSGCQLGLFPSYYEPWGYTPVETAALSVPSLTSNLAGFGRFIKNSKGIKVLNLEEKEELYPYLKEFIEKTHNERVKEKIYAKEAIECIDWKYMVKNYISVYNSLK